MTIIRSGILVPPVLNKAILDERISNNSISILFTLAIRIYYERVTKLHINGCNLVPVGGVLCDPTAASLTFYNLQGSKTTKEKK